MREAQKSAPLFADPLQTEQKNTGALNRSMDAIVQFTCVNNRAVLLLDSPHMQVSRHASLLTVIFPDC